MTDFTAEKTDLSTPQAQALFKGMQRVSLITNIVMGVVAVMITGIAIWASTTMRGVRAGWEEIVFYVLIAAILAYLLFVVVWEVLNRRKYLALTHSFIAEGFAEQSNVLADSGEIAFELYLAGDCLFVMREGCEDVVRLDLTPVKSYTTVCAGIVRHTKKFLCAYYFNCAQTNGGGVPESVVICDKIGKKEKRQIVVAQGKPVKDCSKSYWLKHEFFR
ncbi:MAG: hypothetical protein K2K39_00450 [Clostridia bacterium]|nr:hypothetical protein [Clostridia bacterium]